MEEKNYKAIAKIIKDYKEDIDSDIYPDLINDLADYFEKEGLKETAHEIYYQEFSKKQFLKDCGIKSK